MLRSGVQREGVQQQSLKISVTTPACACLTVLYDAYPSGSRPFQGLTITANVRLGLDERT